MRGLLNARSVALLHALAHNLRHMMRLALQLLNGAADAVMPA